MKLGIGSVELSPVKAAIIRVAAKVNGESLRTRTAKIIDGHVARFAGTVYARDVAYIAKAHGITWEEAFTLLAGDRPSPFKKRWTKADLAWASKQVHLIRREDLVDGSKLGLPLSPGIYEEIKTSAIPADVAVAVEEGLRAGIEGRQADEGDFSAYALGCRLASVAKDLIGK